MSWQDSLYAKLPTFAQHMAVSVYGFYWHWLRFGPGYDQFVQNYREHEKFSFSQWQDWQSDQLRKLLPACAEHVPYYDQRWSASQKQAAIHGDLMRLPLLEKEPIRADP